MIHSANKTMLITGAGSGLGKQIARALAGTGLNVVVNYRSDSKAAEQTVKALEKAGSPAIAVKADVTDWNSVQALFERAVDTFEGVDILVNNVGEFIFKDFDSTSIEEWQSMFASNLHSSFYCCKAALPWMRQQQWGRIINVGLANSGVKAYHHVIPYAIAKTGVHILTKSLAVQEAGNGITVNVVAPGLMDNGKLDADQLAGQKQSVPMGRSGSGMDMAGAISYLASEQAGYVTGAEIMVSGGWGI